MKVSGFSLDLDKKRSPVNRVIRCQIILFVLYFPNIRETEIRGTGLGGSCVAGELGKLA